MKNTSDFLSETLWVLYGLYFQPTTLERHLCSQFAHGDGDRRNLVNIFSRLHQSGAWRYVTQVALLCTFASFPPFAVMLLTLHVPNYGILLGIYLAISFAGIGMAFLRGALGPITAFIFAGIISTSVDFEHESIAAILLVFTENYNIFVSLLIGVITGFVIHLISRRLRNSNVHYIVDDFGQWISTISYVIISCLAFVVLLSTATSVLRNVTEEILSDTILIIAATISVVITTVVSVGVWFSVSEAFVIVVAAGLATSVSVIVDGNASIFFSAVTLCIVVVLASGSVRFVISSLIAIVIVTSVMSTVLMGLMSLAQAPPSLLAFVAIALGFGLGAKRWGKWDFIITILILLLLIPIFGLEYPKRQLLWLIAGMAGYLRLPLLFIYVVWSALGYFLSRQFKINPIIWLALAPWRYDELIPLKLPYLENILILGTNQDRQMGHLYIQEAAQTWRQVRASELSVIHLAANQLSQCRSERQIANFIDDLGWLSQNSPDSLQFIMESMEEVSRLINSKLTTVNSGDQLIYLTSATEKLKNLLQRLELLPRYENKIFAPIIQSWWEILKRITGSLPNPYIAGNPISTEGSSLFVGREDILRQLDSHLQHRSQRPAVLLFGQRRMGKSSLLYQLPVKLHTDIVPVIVDCQQAGMRESNAALLFQLARIIQREANEHRGVVLPKIPTLLELREDPFTIWGEWIERVELNLGRKRLLLAFDEFEALEEAIQKQWLDERILGFLRNLIQHHPKLDLLLVISHRPIEFPRFWNSYLISVNTLEISYLNSKEARRLVEQPIPGFGLRYQPEAVDHIIALTRCHPLLVQLLCQELVHLLNESNERVASFDEVEVAIPRAFVRGSTFYFQYLSDEAGKEGNEILARLAKGGPNATVKASILTENQPVYEEALQQLLARDLVEEAEGGIRFEVELVRRWWAQQP